MFAFASLGSWNWRFGQRPRCHCLGRNHCFARKNGKMLSAVLVLDKTAKTLYCCWKLTAQSKLFAIFFTFFSSNFLKLKKKLHQGFWTKMQTFCDCSEQLVHNQTWSFAQYLLKSIVLLTQEFHSSKITTSFTGEGLCHTRWKAIRQKPRIPRIWHLLRDCLTEIWLPESCTMVCTQRLKFHTKTRILNRAALESYNQAKSGFASCIENCQVSF